MRGAALGAVRVLVLGPALLVAACGAGPASSPADPATPSAEAISPGLPPTVAPPTTTPATATPAPTVPGSIAVEDPSLLALLPAEVDGHPLELEPYAFADAITDEAFATNIEAAAFAVVVAGDDLASGVVARPVPGVFGDAWFRDWRDSYDRGACDQAGGVARTAEAAIDGRTVWITTCAGGLRTYHAWVEERGLLVSAFALGEGRLGERLMEGLRP